MNTISDRGLGRVNWSGLVMFVLGFWLSASFILDAVIVPSLSAAGMMNQGGFASAGYLLFGIFNRLELVCAAAILTCFLVFRRQHSLSHLREGWAIVLAAVLLAIPFIYTYFLTPQLSAWGLSLSLSLADAGREMPPAMISLHGYYWALEAVKFVAGVTLLRWCYRDSCSLT